MDPPAREDWGDVDTRDLDANYALKQFCGKTFAEAMEMFERNALHYGEDLESMPYKVLNFYAPAFAAYITSKKAKGDSDGASSFLRRTIWLLEAVPRLVSDETKTALLTAAEQVTNNQGFYEADPDIYGNFLDLWEDLQAISE